uniref:Uncharacterized protein n=1 Tax=Anguilla anguilla TaxID=7936 RepID=A0A0E9UKJ2_ANGAN
MAACLSKIKINSPSKTLWVKLSSSKVKEKRKKEGGQNSAPSKGVAQQIKSVQSASTARSTFCKSLVTRRFTAYLGLNPLRMQAKARSSKAEQT